MTNEENDHDSDDVDVHIYEGTEDTLKVWLPTWKHKKPQSILRKQKEANRTLRRERKDHQHPGH